MFPRSGTTLEVGHSWREGRAFDTSDMLAGSLAPDHVLGKSICATRLVVFVAIDEGIDVLGVVDGLLTPCKVGKLAWGYILDKL